MEDTIKASAEFLTTTPDEFRRKLRRSVIRGRLETVPLRAWFAALVVAMVAAFFAGTASAEPGTVGDDGTAPTFSPPITGGAPLGYRMYRDCDISAQSVGVVVDAEYASGKAWSMPMDTDTPTNVCIVGWNLDLEDVEQLGEFDTLLTFGFPASAPGAVEDLLPGGCVAVTGVENAFDCRFIVVP